MAGNGEFKQQSRTRVEDEMERARSQIVTSAQALRREVAMTTDWREWTRRKPLWVVAGAFALGFLFATRR